MNTTVGKLTVEAPEGRPETTAYRSFNAPRDLVFMAHTSCEHMKHWWGPRSTSFQTCSVDFREGGAWAIKVTDSDGNDAPFKGVYKEIVPNERITWTFIYDVAPYDTEEVLETIIFTEEDGVTTLTTTSFYPSVRTRDYVLNSGMTEGAAETWDRLEEYAQSLA